MRRPRMLAQSQLRCVDTSRAPWLTSSIQLHRARQVLTLPATHGNSLINPYLTTRLLVCYLGSFEGIGLKDEKCKCLH